MILCALGVYSYILQIGILLRFNHSFLAHLAEGNVSFCLHFASVVRPTLAFFKESSSLKLLNGFC